MEDSDNSSDDEDPTSTATPNSSRSSRPYIKETVIRFLENKISNRNVSIITNSGTESRIFC